MATDVFVHEALYYERCEEFLSGCLDFVRQGLDADQPVLVAVPEPRMSHLRDHLGDESVRFLNMADVGRNPNRILPWVLRAFVGEHWPRSVRIIGEPIFVGRRPEEIDIAVQHEALINVAFAGVDCAILCPYDIRQLPDVVPDADRTHPVIVCGTQRRVSSAYTDPLAVVSGLNRPLPERMVVDEAIVFDVDQLAHMRAVVGEHARANGINGERVRDVVLAVSEICTNAVIHGGPRLAALRMWTEDDSVVYEVRGAGHIADVMAGRKVPPPDQLGGRGLLIANRICDLVQTYSVPEVTVTRLHCRVSPT